MIIDFHSVIKCFRAVILIGEVFECVPGLLVIVFGKVEVRGR